MPFGITVKNLGTFFVDDRRDIWESREIQAALGKITAPRQIICLCSQRIPGAGEMFLERYTLPVAQQSGFSKYRVDCRDLNDNHHADCPACGASGDDDQAPSEKKVLGNWEESKNWIAFRRAARRLFSRATADCAIALAATKSPRNYCAAFARALQRALTTEDVLPYCLAVAAPDHGLELVTGLCHEPIVDPLMRGGLVPLIFEALEEPAPGQYVARRTTLSLPAEFARRLRQTIRMGSRHIPPPYWIFALKDRRGNCVNCALFPVEASRGGIHSVESDYERWRVDQLIVTGPVPFKPMRVDDLNRWWAAVCELKSWPFTRFQCRPDMLILERDRAIIEEVRGVRPSQNTYYDELMTWKMGLAAQMRQQTRVEFRESNAWEIKQWYPNDYALWKSFPSFASVEIYDELLHRLDQFRPCEREAEPSGAARQSRTRGHS